MVDDRRDGIEHAADGFPVPQRAALSTTRGHHWILEDNTAVQRVIQLFGGQVYKRYRLYEKAI